MGHRSVSSTQGYYSITVMRTRAAVDALAAFQFDRNGTRVWREKSSAPKAFHASGIGHHDETGQLRILITELEQRILDLRQQLQERADELDAAT